MKLLHAIDPRRICLLRHHSKADVLNEIVDCGAQAGLPCDSEELKERISYREQLMSTGIGLEIGLPHVRMEGITDPCIIIGVQPDGIIDYESIDNLPVKIVVMILVGKDQHRVHLELLAQIVAILKRRQTREALLTANTPDKIYRIFSEEVSHA